MIHAVFPTYLAMDQDSDNDFGSQLIFSIETRYTILRNNLRPHVEQLLPEESERGG